MNEDYNYFQDAEFRQSLADYERMLETGEYIEFESETLTDIAEYYAMEQRMDEANRCIRYALSFYPDSVDPQIFLSRQQMFAGNEKEAWQLCRKIADQDDREVIFLKAELNLYFNKPEKAYQLLMEAYRNSEDQTEAANMLSDAICLCRDYDKFQKALEWVKILHNKHPEYENSDVMEAELRTLLGQPGEALMMMTKHLEKHPYNTQAWIQLAEAHLAMSQYDEAAEAVDFVLAIDNEHAEALIMRGNILYDTEKPKEAHEYYKRFLGYFPNDERVRYLDAECLMDMGEYEEAMRRLSDE